jgi:segregation and condensation protein A
MTAAVMEAVLAGEGGAAHGLPEEGPGPVALVRGVPWSEVPRDLYIPPDALEVILEAFSGPLDLLLYLIKRHNLDVLDIPIAEVTRQYMEYIDLMRELRLELAAEYLLMAATLAEIKSRMLLPRPPAAEAEEDPRAELVRRLQEYERIRQAALGIDALPRVGREVFAARAEGPGPAPARPPPTVTLRELLLAMRDLMARAELFAHHHVRREPLSVRERMTRLLERLADGRFHELAACLDPEEGRPGVVVTVLALLELVKEALIELVQTEPFGPIHLRAAA